MRQRIAKVSVWAALALCLPSQNQAAFAATTYTFTSAGASGASGPTASQLTTAYSSTNLAGQVSESTSVGIQLWTVPQTGNYTILAIGASGGSGTNSAGGFGAKIQGDFNLVAGTVLQIAVGQAGTAGASGVGGGGGGSFVTGLQVSDSRSVYVIAGGGGGGARWAVSESSTINATLSDPSNPGANSIAFNSNGASGGYGGAGVTNAGAGGGGLLSNGSGGDSYAYGGLEFIKGATGGSGSAPGGFGGGGSGEYSSAGGEGGGGGYSGGGGGSSLYGYGGGGSSLNRGANQVNLVASTAGGGSVIITLNYAIVLGTISVALQGGGTSPYYRTVSNLVGTVNETSTVTFFQNSKPIPGCRSMYAVTSVSCAWKPSVMGNAVITDSMVPLVQGSTAGSSAPLFLSVIPRNSLR